MVIIPSALRALLEGKENNFFSKLSTGPTILQIDDLLILDDPNLETLIKSYSEDIEPIKEDYTFSIKFTPGEPEIKEEGIMEKEASEKIGRYRNEDISMQKDLYLPSERAIIIESQGKQDYFLIVDYNKDSAIKKGVLANKEYLDYAKEAIGFDRMYLGKGEASKICFSKDRLFMGMFSVPYENIINLSMTEGQSLETLFPTDDNSKKA